MLRAHIAALAVCVGALALARDASADPRFDPYFNVELTQPAPQTPASLTFRFGVPEGSSLFSAATFSIPQDWGVVRGETIPIGARLGIAHSFETFGIINGACNTSFPIDFDLLNASLDRARTVSFLDADSPGHWEGDSFIAAAQLPDFAEDKDGNNLHDAIDLYPDFLNDTLGDSTPIIRLAGLNSVLGHPVLLQFLIFAPGNRINVPDQFLAKTLADASQTGYPAMLVIQDFRNLENAHWPGPVTDHCTPYEMSVSLSSANDALPALINPQAGTYAFSFTGVSKRDFDGDGWTNDLDTCPYRVNIGTPRIPGDGDADNDGLDAICDPNDEPWRDGIYYGSHDISEIDVDVDGYLTRQDNCPLVVNGPTDYYSPQNISIYWESHTQPDTDFDDIGDACDQNPESPDGEAPIATRTATVVVGDPEGSGGPPNAVACPHCYRPEGPAQDSQEAEDGDNTGQLAVAVGLIGLGAGATAIVVGGGTVYLLRRRRQ